MALEKLSGTARAGRASLLRALNPYGGATGALRGGLKKKKKKKNYLTPLGIRYVFTNWTDENT